MMTFQDPSNVLGRPAGDQMLLLEFQNSTVAGGHMLLNTATTQFNIYDNTTGDYFLGQSNTNSLAGWLAAYPGLTGSGITGLRIGEGLAGPGCTGNCSESLTVYSLDISSTPEPVSVVLIGTGLLGLGWLKRKM
jgi:hypothetical protein